VRAAGTSSTDAAKRAVINGHEVRRNRGTSDAEPGVATTIGTTKSSCPNIGKKSRDCRHPDGAAIIVMGLDVRGNHGRSEARGP
jgi:hypothetical protein